MEWGDRHLGDGPPPLALDHRECGAPVRVALVCDAGHELAGPREVQARPGAAGVSGLPG